MVRKIENKEIALPCTQTLAWAILFSYYWGLPFMVPHLFLFYYLVLQ